MAAIRIKRGTKAQLDAAASANGLAAGEPYLITDQGRLAVGTSATAYVVSGPWDGAVSAIDLDGATDIGADLVDADLILVDNGAGGTNRKSAISRIWTYISGKIAAGVTALLSSYTTQGYTGLTASGGTLTIPLDGRAYSYTLAANTTLALSGVPEAPVCADAVIVIKQAASGGPYTVAYPSAWNWPDGTKKTMPTGANTQIELTIRSHANGEIWASAITGATSA